MQRKWLLQSCLLVLLLLLPRFPGAGEDPKDEQFVLELTVTCSGNAHYERKNEDWESRTEEQTTDQVTLTLHDVSRWRIAERTDAAPHGPESELMLEPVSCQPTFTASGGGRSREVDSRQEVCGNRSVWHTARTEANWKYTAAPATGCAASPDISINSGWYRVLEGNPVLEVTSKGKSRMTAETCEGQATTTTEYNVGYAGDQCLLAIENAFRDEKVLTKLAGTFPDNRPASSYSGQASFSYKPPSGPDEIAFAATVNISYQLRFPGGGNYEVVITPPANLGNWKPRGGKDQNTPGDVLKFTGEIKPLGPKKGDDKIKVEVRLESSREPGIAMNFPPGQKGDDSPDLRLLKDQSSSTLTIKEEKGSDPAVYTAEGEFKPGETFTVAVGSFDYGAHGTIEFTSAAPLRINGYPNRSSVGLPRDDNANGIADVWETEMGLEGSAPAEDDKDAQPEGDGTEGDGLSVFEEYRGFMVQGVHKRTRPDRKDIFIYDQSSLGTGYFSESKLAIHLVGNDEFVAQAEPDAINPLVINFNGGTAHLGSQHVVHLVAGDAYGGPGIALPEGFPGPPKTIERIIIDPDHIARFTKSFNLDPQQFRRSVIAHELAHASNVYHHGGANFEFTAKVLMKDKDGNWQPWPDKNSGDVEVVAASFGGRNSGVERCIMRYNSAHFYRVRDPKATFRIRYDPYEDYLPLEPAGTTFCTDPKGTGVNDKSRKPGPKAGDASCGNCAHQFCVNDVKGCKYNGKECVEKQFVIQ